MAFAAGAQRTHTVKTGGGLFHAAASGDPKKRQTMMLAAGALLVVLYVMHKRNSAAAAAAAPATPAPGDPNAAGAGGLGPSGSSTFADNGAQAGALGDSVTSGLAGVQSSLDAQTSAFQQFVDLQASNGGGSSTGSTGTPGPSGYMGQPAFASGGADLASHIAETGNALRSGAQPWAEYSPGNIDYLDAAGGGTYGAAAGPAPAWDPAAAFAYVAAHPSSTPAPAMAARGGPGVGVKVNQQAGNPRQGQNYTTKQLSGGRVEHVYPGRAPVIFKPKAKK